MKREPKLGDAREEQCPTQQNNRQGRSCHWINNKERPSTAVTRPMKMLQLERFLTSAVKFCPDIGYLLRFRFWSSQEGRSSRPPFLCTVVRPASGRLGLRGRSFRLEHRYLRLRLMLGCLAFFLGLLQLRLDLGVELVDFFLELRFPVGVRLGLLGLHLGNVGLHSVDVFFVDVLFYV